MSSMKDCGADEEEVAAPLVAAKADDGGAVYLRLSTRPLTQPEWTKEGKFNGDVIAGAYWRAHPVTADAGGIVYMGAVAPEAEAAQSQKHQRSGRGRQALPDRVLIRRPALFVLFFNQQGPLSPKDFSISLPVSKKPREKWR